jgi:hypothetical protein
MRSKWAAIDEQEEIDEEDGDQHESTDEDVGAEAKHGSVAWEIGRGNMSGFVIVFVHADKLRRKWCGVEAAEEELCCGVRLAGATRRGRGGT